MPVLHYDPINHCHVIFEWPISSYISLYLVFNFSPSCDDVPFSHSKCSSCPVTCCICRIDKHSGMFVDICIASTLMSIHTMYFSSLFSVCLYLDSQSAMKSSGPSLYIILTCFWCVLRRMHWIHCERVARSFFNIATQGLWSVIILTSLAEQQWWNFLRPCNIPNISLLMLLYLCSALVRLLLANVIGISMMSGAVSFGYVIPSLVCNRVAPRPVADYQFQGTGVWFHCGISSIYHLLFMILPCHIGPDMKHSMSRLLCLTSAFKVVHICLQC